MQTRLSVLFAGVRIRCRLHAIAQGLLTIAGKMEHGPSVFVDFLSIVKRLTQLLGYPYGILLVTGPILCKQLYASCRAITPPGNEMRMEMRNTFQKYQGVHTFCAGDLFEYSVEPFHQNPV